MKVLHVFKSYYPYTQGGIEKVIDEIIVGVSRYGIQSDVFALGKTTEVIQRAGYRVFFCKTNLEVASTPFSFSAIKIFKKLHQEYDIVHYHFPYPFADLLHFIARVQKPTLVSYHADIVKQKYWLKLYRPLAIRFLKRVTQIVATSPNYLQTSKLLKQFQYKTRIIPYGLDERAYRHVDPAVTKKWSEQFAGQPFFLFVGVIRYYKGLHILIEAAQNTTYPIVILGTGPMEKELKTQAKRLQVNNVHFVGALNDEDKAALLQLCRAVVFPSHLRSEAFGITLLEGALFAKPLITCQIGTGTTYINQDRQTGLVIPPNDPTALREAMDYLWQHDHAVQEMGKNAYTRYKALFTADKMAQSYAALYQTLCSDQGC